MHLLANKLLEMYGHTTLIYTLSGWQKENVDAATGWNEYLRQKTGVRGYDWPIYPAYLLLDEAQESYWDTNLWADLFKAIQPYVGGPFVMLFSSYGSPNRGFAGFDEEHKKTPMAFAPEQQISMRPCESIPSYMTTLIQSGESTELHTLRPVGLLLEEDEAMDILTQYPSVAAHPFSSLSVDLKKEIFLISDGHVGFITSIVHALKKVPVSVHL